MSPVARNYKTLFLTDLNGQYKMWKTSVLGVCNSVDEVVQMGNIVGCSDAASDIPRRGRRGPNLSMLKYVLLWRATFERWTQLVGPNEIAALNYPDEWTGPDSNDYLRNAWLMDGSRVGMKTAAVNKNRLVTHGGMTYGEWLDIGKPDDPEVAAQRLNEKYNSTLYQGECFVLNQRPNFAANPIFCDPVMELYPSWVTAPVAPPFGQVHTQGYNSVFGREALQSNFSMAKFVDDVVFTNYGSRIELKGSFFFSLSQPIPDDEIVSSYPNGWRMYVEKTPVVDLREGILEGPTLSQVSQKVVNSRYWKNMQKRNEDLQRISELRKSGKARTLPDGTIVSVDDFPDAAENTYYADNSNSFESEISESDV